MTIHQTKQHSSARRLANGSGDPGNRYLIQLLYIHSLMISELSLR